MDVVTLSGWECQHHSVAETQRVIDFAVKEIIRLRSLICEYVDANEELGEDCQFRDWWSVEYESGERTTLTYDKLLKEARREQ
jgi:hypothetical protein